MILKFATAAYVAFLALIVYLADIDVLYRYLPFLKTLPYADKIGHFFLMGTFSFFVNILLKARTVRILGPRIQLGSLLVFAIVFLEECSQAFFPSRTFSLLDLSADLAGIWFFGWLARMVVEGSFRRRPC